MEQDKYYVYVNLNSPLEEDFVFLLTALYNWAKTHPDNSAELLVKDYELICVKGIEPPTVNQFYRFLANKPDEGNEEQEKMISPPSEQPEEPKSKPVKPSDSIFEKLVARHGYPGGPGHYGKKKKKKSRREDSHYEMPYPPRRALKDADAIGDKRCDALVRKIPPTFMHMLQQLSDNGPVSVG